MTTNEKAKKSSCSVDKISLKFDTGDTLFYDNNDSRFDYSARQSKNGIKINANLDNKISDIEQNISDYYSGLGLMIDGVRKGGCNGTQRFKDEKKGLIEEIECANGLRNGVSKEYYLSTDKVKISASYKAGLLDGLFEIYDEKGDLALTLPYKDNQLNGVGQVMGEFQANHMPTELIVNCNDLPKRQKEDFHNSLHESMNAFIGYFTYDEIEFKNGILIGTKFINKDNNEIVGDSIFLNDKRLNAGIYAESPYFNLSVGKENIGGYGERDGYYGACKHKGKCEEMFKELIDKSAFKDKIYSLLENAK